MAELHLLYQTNDHLIELDELKDAVTDAFVNDATVTADIDALDGTNVATAIVMSYIPTSNGKYQGTIQDTLALVLYTFYNVTITAVKAGTKGTWELKAQCVKRQE